MDNFSLNVADVRYEGKGLTIDKTSTITVGTKESPLTVFVESDTDYATVIPSVAGVLVAVLVAWLTTKVQRNQIKSNLSSFRHQWMVELRGCASEYLQSLYSMAMRLENHEGYRVSPECLAGYERIAVLTCKFELLLSRDDPDTQKIFDLDQEIMDDLNVLKFGQDTLGIIGKLNLLKGMLREELEGAWMDVKSDVGHIKK